tara:strand:- start:14064 stop:15191 length:1128 start_codon:yes stop_codon:yes gene_type:complete
MIGNRDFFVGRPNIGDQEVFLKRTCEILESRWLSNGGQFCEELERKFSELLGVKHCVAMCNGTIGLEIAARAAGLEGEVIVPSFTFIATAHCLQWQAITPVFCDVDPVTHNLDPSKIEDLITPRTSGILGVHCWGRSCDISGLEDIARRHGLKLLFDASHALGCSSQGRMIGGFGEAEVFSLHATKFVNAFEGGIVTTNNGELANKMRLMRNFGFTNYDQVDYIGTNGKMSEISAAMGLTNLESIEEFIAVNRGNFDAYQDGLAGLPGISLISYDENESCNWQYVVVEVDSKRCSKSRDMIVEYLHRHNVIARRYFYPGCHRMEPYCSSFPSAGLLLPVTENLCQRVIVLPTGTTVSTDDIAWICSVFRECVNLN